MDCSDPQDLPRAQPQGLTRVHRGRRGMDSAGSLAHPGSLECNGPHLGRRLLGDQGQVHSPVHPTLGPHLAASG